MKPMGIGALCMFLENFINFYGPIQKLYENKLRGPIIMPHHVDPRCNLVCVCVTGCAVEVQILIHEFRIK